MEDYGLTREKLVHLYKIERISQKKIGKSVGVSQDVIARWLRENDIEFNSTSKKVIMDDHYFDSIDTEEKAYWLGFIWSDGSIIQEKSGRLALKIDLSEVDIEHLGKLKSAWNSTAILKTYKHGKGAFKTDYDVCRLMSNSRHMCEVLLNSYGMIPYRTCGDQLFDNTPKSLHRHLIRGIIDADGSVIHYINGAGGSAHSISFSVAHSIANHIDHFLLENNLISNVSQRYKRNIGRDGDVIGISYGGGKQVESILRVIYGDSNVKLDRKYQKYLEIIEDRKRYNV